MTKNENIEENKGGLGRIVALVSLVAIALGGFNDTTDALMKIYDFSLSKFTDIPSQKKLNKIYIRASSATLDENFGAPVYIKHTYKGDVIKYYSDDRFVISAISKDNAISAYLVFPERSFDVDTQASAGGKDLLKTPFSDQEIVNDIRATLSPTITYYIEENASGEFKNLYSSVSGYSEFNDTLETDKRAILSELVDVMLFGEDVSTQAIAVRNELKPNFYGYSTLGLGVLEEAILTRSEFRLINP